MVARPAAAAEDVWRVLGDVLDPEVPALSVVELGIVRAVRVEESGVTVSITPTYSGCPAMHEIERAIVSTLAAHGVAPVRVETIYSPSWTTDWISDAAREKLRAYGIAPPAMVTDDGLIPLLRRRTVTVTRCPFCGSPDTAMRSEFGSTACKALLYCNACHQPFEHFKSL